MADGRLREYAELLVGRCVDVQPGWQVLVESSPSARPLVDEVLRAIARRGAWALPRLELPGLDDLWLKEAPAELAARIPPIEAYALEHADCRIIVEAPANTRDGSDVPAERLSARRQARRTLLEPYMAHRKPWVLCQYPTQALAQDAGMTLPEFEDFLYGAVLVDWDEIEREMTAIAARFDAAREVRLVGAGTDLRFSLEGRHGKVSGAEANMPSGEVFYSPVEDSAEGVVHFAEYPASYYGREVHGVRLVFEHGRVVDASAETEEEFLAEMLDVDDGARVIGEFGIGCNRGIQRHTKNTLFDEKIYGTIHLALGQSYPVVGGTNASAVHWDMVKDLRTGGRIECDGEVVQENGEWRL